MRPGRKLGCRCLGIRTPTDNGRDLRDADLDPLAHVGVEGLGFVPGAKRLKFFARQDAQGVEHIEQPLVRVAGADDEFPGGPAVVIAVVFHYFGNRDVICPGDADVLALAGAAFD